MVAPCSSPSSSSLHSRRQGRVERPPSRRSASPRLRERPGRRPGRGRDRAGRPSRRGGLAAGPARTRIQAARAQGGRRRHRRYRGAHPLRCEDALRRRSRSRFRARSDHRPDPGARPPDDGQRRPVPVRGRRRHPLSPRSLPRSPQRGGVRYQPQRCRVRRPHRRREPDLEYRLAGGVEGRRPAHGRRLVGGVRHSLPFAALSAGGVALGLQRLPDAAEEERRVPVVGLVAAGRRVPSGEPGGGHRRAPRPAAKRAQPRGQALRPGGHRPGQPGFRDEGPGRCGPGREMGGASGARPRWHRQPRLLPGGGGRGAREPHALLPVLPGEARVLPRRTQGSSSWGRGGASSPRRSCSSSRVGSVSTTTRTRCRWWAASASPAGPGSRPSASWTSTPGRAPPRPEPTTPWGDGSATSAAAVSWAP